MFSPNEAVARMGNPWAVKPLEGDTAAGAALERGSSCLKGMSTVSEAHADT